MPSCINQIAKITVKSKMHVKLVKKNLFINVDYVWNCKCAENIKLWKSMNKNLMHICKGLLINKYV